MAAQAPSAPSPGELQRMALQPAQQARQLFAVQPAPVAAVLRPPQPAAPAGLAPAAQPPLDTSYEDQVARRRVLCISVGIAVYVVIGTVLQHWFDIATMQAALGEIHSITKVPGHNPNVFAMMLNTSPQVVWAIFVGLLVPLCGYLGVKQNNAGLMGAFCSCNALHCCCGILTMVSMGGMLMGTSAAAPGVFEFLERCDPVHCAPRGLNFTAEKRVVDCLAASTWQDYERHFPHGPRLPRECPKVFLECGKHEAIQEQLEEPGSPWSRRLSVFRKAVFEKRREHEWRPEPPPMPENPLASCRPAESVEMFHKARLLAPEMLPKVVLFFAVKLVLMIPFVVLGCFGFCWGKDMWSRLGQGYANLSTPAPAPSEVALQPVMGFAVPPAATEPQLAQPLMLNVPPPLLQQQPALVHVAQASPTTADQE